MEFLKKMKSREMLQMGLKTIAAVVIGIILIFLMEGMIFGIYMNKINNNKESSGHITSNCTAYCVEQENDIYKVYVHNTDAKGLDIFVVELTKEQIEDRNYGKTLYRAPNPFDFSITGVHYVVMGVFIVAILGLYGWRFYKLHREYVTFEKKFKKTGKIFA